MYDTLIHHYVKFKVSKTNSLVSFDINMNQLLNKYVRQTENKSNCDIMIHMHIHSMAIRSIFL